MRKPVFRIQDQQRCRSAFVSMHSDQLLCCWIRYRSLSKISSLQPLVVSEQASKVLSLVIVEVKFSHDEALFMLK